MYRDMSLTPAPGTDIYLRYDNIWDILLQDVATLVYVRVIGYMQAGMEFKRIVWICSFFEFPTIRI